MYRFKYTITIVFFLFNIYSCSGAQTDDLVFGWVDQHGMVKDFVLYRNGSWITPNVAPELLLGENKQNISVQDYTKHIWNSHKTVFSAWHTVDSSATSKTIKSQFFYPYTGSCNRTAGWKLVTDYKGGKGDPNHRKWVVNRKTGYLWIKFNLISLDLKNEAQTISIANHSMAKLMKEVKSRWSVGEQEVLDRMKSKTQINSILQIEAKLKTMIKLQPIKIASILYATWPQSDTTIATFTGSKRAIEKGSETRQERLIEFEYLLWGLFGKKGHADWYWPSVVAKINSAWRYDDIYPVIIYPEALISIDNRNFLFIKASKGPRWKSREWLEVLELTGGKLVSRAQYNIFCSPGYTHH